MHLSPALVHSLPKVALHDHLDGGLRPATVLELCAELDIAPPPIVPAREADGSADVPGGAMVPTSQDVADWFHAAADSGSLPSYLSTFERTLALMQTAPALRRIAREFVEDMVADGVVYAETRWAPHQHTDGGLSLDEAIQAVQDGLDEGAADAERAGKRIVVGQLLAYLRQNEPTEDLVDLAITRRGTGVVGLDLAGPEAGFPASRFRSQFERARRHGVHVTIHAGEADGPASIADALDCGAERIGHGVRLLEDVDVAARASGTAGADASAGADAGGPDAGSGAGGGGGAEAGTAGADASTGAGTPSGFGPVAARVHREQICLEVCPSSNLQTGAAQDLATHAAGALRRGGFAIALSSDNRLMSRTGTSREMTLVAEAFDWDLADLEQVVLTGLDAGFAPAEARAALREEVVLPAFRAAREN
ncbi:adenosine deaminase family protein [Brachybacterium fresconis]|uniref:adenosine deaminase n=1 Tax=Brachybacterium fresconis TaxID=173363 RepID=A0ABS4YJU7_9MICO|nr:adenosine deaminase family protein [Brachybacterium fresconis]MBP2409074.1 adenosine deaminase [Brachybacterium fresconis]